jgi:hypothetical protein
MKLLENVLAAAAAIAIIVPMHCTIILARPHRATTTKKATKTEEKMICW